MKQDTTSGTALERIELQRAFLPLMLTSKITSLYELGIQENSLHSIAILINTKTNTKTNTKKLTVYTKCITYLAESCFLFLSFQHMMRTNMTTMRITARTIAIISTGSIPEEYIISTFSVGN